MIYTGIIFGNSLFEVLNIFNSLVYILFQFVILFIHLSYTWQYYVNKYYLIQITYSNRLKHKISVFGDISEVIEHSS